MKIFRLALFVCLFVIVGQFSTDQASANVVGWAPFCDEDGNCIIRQAGGCIAVHKCAGQSSGVCNDPDNYLSFNAENAQRIADESCEYVQLDMLEPQYCTPGGKMSPGTPDDGYALATPNRTECNPNPPRTCGSYCETNDQNFFCASGFVCDVTRRPQEDDQGTCVIAQCNATTNPDANNVCTPDGCALLPSPTPTDAPTPTPTAGPQCLSITMSPPQPAYGELITFTCGAVPNVNQYKFRIQVPDGTVFERDGSATNPNVAQPGLIARWVGNYTAECTICPDGNCLPFEDITTGGTN